MEAPLSYTHRVFDVMIWGKNGEYLEPTHLAQILVGWATKPFLCLDIDYIKSNVE